MERTHFILQIALSFLLLLVFKLPGSQVIAQPRSGDELANDLRRNVVRVIARWKDQSGLPRSINGFGFVVGERNGLLYIVTANHVVRSRETQKPETPFVIFFQDQGKEYQADLLINRLPEFKGDFAVIRVRRPPGFSWRTAAQASKRAKRKDEVRFIGLDGMWFVPVQPGSVDNVEPFRVIHFEKLAIRTGTSGAPLVGNNGIFGMITVDNSGYGEATPIEIIERKFREWEFPWGLTKWLPPARASQQGSAASQQGSAASQQGSAASQQGVPASPPQAERWVDNYTVHDNRDLWLGDIPRPDKAIGTRNVDLDECAQECNDNNGCVAFVYDRWNRACYLKNKITLSLLDPHSLIAVKKPGKLPDVSQKKSKMVSLYNQRMRGNVIISKKAANYRTCRSACKDSLRCVAFNFFKQASRKKNCQMFNLSDGYSADHTVDAGYKHQVP